MILILNSSKHYIEKQLIKLLREVNQNIFKFKIIYLKIDIKAVL